MSAPTLAFKGVAVDEGTDSQLVDINEAEGLVTAVVSVTGVKDDVDDVIEPGAYTDTLKVRNPKVCWHHSWDQPVGRTLHIVELMPGDPRLPTKQRNGLPWPKEGGALVATMQFNMKSERGREAFEAVRFFSETGECEWSIGYQVPAGKSRRDKQGVRWIKALDLFELSFVLFGAHNMTGTLALKAAVLVMSRHLKDVAAGAVVVGKEEFDLVIKSLDYTETKDSKADDEDEDKPKPPADDANDTPPPADEPPADAPTADEPPADAPAADAPPADAPAADEPPADAPPPVPDATADGAADPGDPIEDDGAQEQEVLLFDDDQGIPEDGSDDPTDTPPPDDDEDEDEDKPKPAGKALAAAHLEMRLVAADPWYAATFAEGKAADEAKRKLTAEQRRKKPTLPGSDTAWPIGDRTDLEAAIRSFGRAKPDEKDKVKRWIIKRARELGATDALPDSWNVSKALPSDVDTDIETTCTCGDEVVFDTGNGWQGKDGSYSHDDGSTHGDHLEPPTIDELADAKGWTFEQYLTAALTDGINQALSKAFKIDLTPLGEIKADTTPGDKPGNAAELIQWYERGEGAAKIRWGEDGDFMRCVHIAEKHMTPEQAKGFCSNRHLGALGVRPGQEKAYAADDDLADTPPPDQMANEDEKDPDDPHESGVMVALFLPPEAAEQMVVRGGEPAEELHITLAYLGKVTDQAGDGMSLGDSIGKIVAAAQIAAATHQPLSGTIGGIGKFPDSGDGVPIWAPADVVGLGALREDVVTALTDAGLPVKTDHGFTPHVTLGYNLDLDLVPPVEGVSVTFDKVVVAAGQERQEVQLGGDADIPVSGAPVNGEPLNPPLPGDEQKAAAYDPRIETGPDAGHRPAVPRHTKSFPYLEGTYEERQRTLDRALSEALLPEPDGDEHNPSSAYLSIDGTWPDRVVCTVHNWAGPGPDDAQSYEVSYVLNDDGSVSLGEPEKVKLSVIAVDEDGDELGDDVPVGDLLPLAEMVEAVTGGMKSVGVGTEQKAGRVLSGANAQRLKTAVEHLISVLAAAGIEISDPTNEQARTNPTVDDETTAPAARDGKALTVDVAGDLSQFADLLQES